MCIAPTHSLATAKMVDGQQRWSVQQPQMPDVQSAAMSETPYHAADMLWHDLSSPTWTNGPPGASLPCLLCDVARTRGALLSRFGDSLPHKGYQGQTFKLQLLVWLGEVTAAVAGSHEKDTPATKLVEREKSQL